MEYDDNIPGASALDGWTPLIPKLTVEQKQDLIDAVDLAAEGKNFASDVIEAAKDLVITLLTKIPLAV